MTKQERIESTRETVKSVLSQTYNISSIRADKMVEDSVFNEMLLEDPEFVGHRRAEYWAKQVFEEFNTVR
ncbi:hypothetical protein [Saccharibacillus sp. JS10]|uniref:hypothetical protein n=1 Tax=Saccharibacillus sp. JS10 TaxID=2950552 RepID=UPI00210A6FCB|nr:hypothetical protein [Saccharibacillus sp. JS10]MCQ4087394.1 hypothetical protein [Saccharibacillus sp. JS10]